MTISRPSNTTPFSNIMGVYPLLQSSHAYQANCSSYELSSEPYIIILYTLLTLSNSYKLYVTLFYEKAKVCVLILIG